MKIKSFNKTELVGFPSRNVKVINASITDENDKVWPVYITKHDIAKDETIYHFEIAETKQTGFVKYEWVMTESMVITPDSNKEQ